MSWVAVGVGGAALVGGIAGSVISSNGAKDAAQTQAEAAGHAADLQYQQYQQQREDQTPWREAGATALGQLGDPSFNQKFNPSDMESVDPGYSFRMQEGQKALERSAAARGGLQSGGTLKALTQYGQDYASGEYQNAYNRFTTDQTNRFNRLATVAGIGQTANGQIGQAGMNMANNAGNEITGAANAQGAAQIAGANAWGSTLSGLGTNGANWMMQNQMMNRFAPGYRGAPGGSLGSIGTEAPLVQPSYTPPTSSYEYLRE